MFEHIIYYIIVLLIFSSYDAPEVPPFTTAESLVLFLCTTTLFALISWLTFRRMAARAPFSSDSAIDLRFHAALKRLSIVAVIVFIIDIYGFNMPLLFSGIPVLDKFPTLTGLCFLLFFVLHLAVIWNCAYGIYRRYYNHTITRRQYLFSSILFSLPALLPWFLLSLVSDILMVLPHEAPRRILSTPGGELCYFVIFLIAIALFGPVLIQKLWKCKPLADGKTRRRIDALLRRVNVRYKEILEWPLFGGSMITAGVMGLVNRFRYILVTPALLRLLEPEEIDAVVAHEIGHVKHRHLWYYLLLFFGYLALLFSLFVPLINIAFYNPLVFWFMDASGFSEERTYTYVSALTIILAFVLYFRFIFGYLMRNFERQADLYVYKLFYSARPLISTFAKMTELSRQSADKPNWHHFSIRQRVEFLERCETNRNRVRLHNRKVARILLILFSGITLASALGYGFSHSRAGKNFNNRLTEKMVLWKIERLPEEIDRYSILGDYYYNIKNYEKTIEAYRTAITLRPEKPQSFNNLAWLFATCEEKVFRNPEQALILAQRAAELKEAPHILDTLAESYYVNGRFDEAVSAGTRALNLAKDNRAYYENQLKKFSRAL